MSGTFRPDIKNLRERYYKEYMSLVIGTEDQIKEAASPLFKHADEELRAFAYFQAGMACAITEKAGWTEKSCRECVEYLEKALELFPRWPQAHMNIGVALSKIGDIEKTLHHYERAMDYYLVSEVNYYRNAKDAALIGRLWLFLANTRLQLNHKESLVKARVEFEKGKEILLRHRDDDLCLRWLKFADQVEVKLSSAERIQGVAC